MKKPALPRQLVGMVFATLLASAHAAALPRFDFTQPGDTARWEAAHDVAPLVQTPAGLLLKITGPDPFIQGPPAQYNSPTPLHARIRLKSDVGGFAQLFWFTTLTTEEHSVFFAVASNAWTEVCLPLPPLPPGSRLRLDPPGTTGNCILAALELESENTSGITHLTATANQLEFKLQGVRPPFDVVELAPYQTLSDAASAPVVRHISRDPRGMVTVPRFETNGTVVRDRLYSAFVPRPSQGTPGRSPVGPARFVEEFRGVSKYTQPFPSSTSKKGLQIQMADDALQLGVQHAALNLNLTALVDLTRNPANLTWSMDGTTYYFNRAYVESLPVKAFSDAGGVVTMILLASRSGNPAVDAVMLHPQRAAVLPNGLAAFNTQTPEGVRHFKACLEFLAERFSRPYAPAGRVANFIIGNEVTTHWEWLNLGEMPRELAVAEYERAVRLAQTAVRKYSASARVLLSLDHHWTLVYGANPRRAIAGRHLLEEFNRRARLGGNFEWHLAYHPYPENLFQPRTWLDKSALPSPDSPRITFKNLEQLTAFFRRPEFLLQGQPRRIILSEQGFHSDNTAAGDEAQAAAYCYAWQKVARLEGIDAFILHRHVDHSGEGGLNLGLWRRQPNSIATPATPRPMYDVFRHADQPDWETSFRFALPIIGLRHWDDLFTPP